MTDFVKDYYKEILIILGIVISVPILYDFYKYWSLDEKQESTEKNLSEDVREPVKKNRSRKYPSGMGLD